MPGDTSGRELLRTRKTECGAKQFLLRLVVRAAPFALLSPLKGLRIRGIFVRGDCFKPANLFFPNFQRKRFKIKQIGRIKSVYLVQSLHAPHSK
jgi:hypothetical protein